MTTSRLLDAACIAGIVRDVGLDRLLDELIERLTDRLANEDADVAVGIARTGFRYDKPDLGLIEWMPVLETGRRVSIKTVGYHPGNPVQRRTPSVLSTTSLYDTTDGRLVALCESTFLTALRTGVASAVATDVLAIGDAATLGVIGCGAQAVTQIHATARVRPIERVIAFDADPDVAATLGDRLARAGLEPAIDVVERVEDAVTQADVLCTATSVAPGAGPVVPEDVTHRPWLHVNAVGADLPGKFELPLGMLRRATIFPDVLEQCRVEGEIQRLDDAELVDLGPELGELIRRRRDHEHRRGALTVFDSTGWAFEDLVAAEVALDHAERLGLGLELDLQPAPTDPHDPYDFLWA